MIDFTNAIEKFNNYQGSEKKKTLIYNNIKYLVKFPDPIGENSKNVSYINNAFSEYIGSNIFKMAEFEARNTLLGKYYYKGKEKIVCACEDFTDNEHILYEFENLALSTNLDRKIETELTDIMDVLEESKMIDTKEIKEKFWDMFVIDSLIGNTDRHNGNWGFLLNKQTNEITFSPIYDCGSCLNPLLEDTELENMNSAEIKNLAINCYSCIKLNEKKINYMSFMQKMENKECNDAIKRKFKKVNINEIHFFIDGIECISDIRKKFYKEIISYRYNNLKNIYEKLKS